MIDDGFVSDHARIIITQFAQLVQLEAEKFRSLQNIVVDYYCAKSAKVGARWPRDFSAKFGRGIGEAFPSLARDSSRDLRFYTAITSSVLDGGRPWIPYWSSL